MVHLGVMDSQVLSWDIHCVHEEFPFFFDLSQFCAATTRVGLQGHSVDELFIGADPEIQRCIAPVRPRLVGWAAPFWAVLPSGYVAALGYGLGLRLRLCFARHVGTDPLGGRQLFRLPLPLVGQCRRAFHGSSNFSAQES